MQKTVAQYHEMKLVGISCRTNNVALFKSDPEKNIVAATVQKYFHNALYEKIQHKKNPGTTYCVYTNYESDVNGDYTYFIGEEVTDFDNISDEFETLTIPTQQYAKFTHGPGKMPEVCIDTWKHIWTMTPADLGGERSYTADFEIYDERSKDHQNVTLDIYIAINRNL